eukprot:SAG11_NODE_9_length_28972_cov_81.532539_12_plen_59_part_00
MEEELKKIYYDPDVNTSSAKRLYQVSQQRFKISWVESKTTLLKTLVISLLKMLEMVQV